jgi:hypothetical protein
VPSVGRGRRDQDDQQQSERIHDDMTLAAPQLLAAVVAPKAADLAALDRLAVDAPGPRRRPPTGRLSHPLTQGVEDALPGAVVPPLLEVVVDGALGRQVVREHVPLAARAGLIEDRVEDLAISTSRGRPSFEAGISGSAMAHCSSVMSDGQGLRIGACPVVVASCRPPDQARVYGDEALPDSL